MTLGWIKEDAEEAFWAGTDVVPNPHRGSGSVCPFCGKNLPDNQQLFAHLHSEHTRERPVLLIRGQEPTSPHTLRYQLERSDIAVENAAAVFIKHLAGDRRSVPAVDVGRALAQGSGFVDIELVGRSGVNESTLQSTYRIFYKAPTAAQYIAADRDFVTKFSQGTPKLADIPELFDRHSNAVTSEYVSALCDYVQGVLIKDRDPATGVRPPYADYHLAYIKALQILKDTPRPLSQLVAKTIRFALNDFGEVPYDSGFEHLDAAYATLYCLAQSADQGCQKTLQDEVLSRRAIYPLDAGTSNVIELAVRFARLDRWSPVDSQRAMDLAGSAALSGYDRAKVVALWASTAFRLAGVEAARDPLGQLLSNDCFSAWASAKLGLT